MGVLCPFCNTWQPIVRNITADGEPPKKALDVLARKLGCGHVIGSDKYNKYIAEVNKIDVELMAKVTELNEKAAAKKAALWATIAEEEVVK